MNGHQQPNRLKYSIILALGFGVAQIANAVGLGPIVGVNSHLGQPLSANIRVDNISKEQAQSASVSLASADEYRSRGIQRLPSHDQLRFKLVPAGNGYRIQVTSKSGIREPFINFLLTINVGGQKITREYALFLNPEPGGSASPAASESAAPVASVTPAEASPKAVPLTTPAANNLPAPQPPSGNVALGYQPDSCIGTATPSGVTPASAEQPNWGGAQPSTPNPQAGNAQPNAGGGKYTVRSGDTLYRIASATAPRGTDVNAMMHAIQRANPHAFGNASMNSLKAGATLTIPGAATSAVASAEATPSAHEVADNNNRGKKRRPAKKAPVAPDSLPAETPPTDELTTTAPEMPQTGSDMPPVEEGAEQVIVAEVASDSGGTTTPEGTTPENTGEQTIASTQQDVPTGMDTTLVLEGVDGIGNGLTGEPPAMETPPGEVASITPDPIAPPAETAETQETVAQASPAAADTTATPPPVAQQPATVQNNTGSGLKLPFGLQLWHLLLAGGLLLSGILLALLLKARGRRRTDSEEFSNMSPADIDRMVAELESDNTLQRSLSDQLHDLDELSYESLSQEKEKQRHPARQPKPGKEASPDLLKSRMTELEALKNLEDEDDDFEQLSRKAEKIPSFDLHVNSGQAPRHEAEKSHTHTQDARKREMADNLFGDWDFNEQEPAVQTSAHESNVDDFFNVDEKLEEIIKPTPAAERVNFSRAPAHAGAQTAQTAILEAEASAEKIEAMEINLDLATSFIATGNAARARVWLEEVMLEGSAAQKALAAQLLKKVDTYK